MRILKIIFGWTLVLLAFTLFYGLILVSLASHTPIGYP